MRRSLRALAPAAAIAALVLGAQAFGVQRPAAQGFSPLNLFSPDQTRESYPQCAGLYLARLEWEAEDGNPVADVTETIARARRFIALEVALDRADRPAGPAGEEAAMEAVSQRVDAYRRFYLSQRDPARMQAFQGDPGRALALMRCDALSGQ